MALLNVPNELLEGAYSPDCRGIVTGLRGGLILADLPTASIGDLCRVANARQTEVRAEVVAFSGTSVSLAPLDSLDGIFPGAAVMNSGRPLRVDIPHDLRGCILDAMGRCVSPERAASAPRSRLEINAEPPHALSRKPVLHPLATGIKSIDALLTVGIGQRIGIFAPPGAGKSTLLGMIARNAEVDVAVVALVGERGREVNDFLHSILGHEGLKKSVVVIATSDENAVRRVIAPKTATAIAEHYRRQGKNVLLLIDSLTRTARAIRELGLAMGEIPVRQGYTPSVYTELPKLLERAGNDASGSVTAVYSVLVNGEEEEDPLAEELKSLLDGHIILSDSEAQRGIRPAIDVTKSGSRLLSSLRDPAYLADRDLLVRLLSRIRKDKDILLLGGTPDGELEIALRLEGRLNALLTQPAGSAVSMKTSEEEMRALAAQARDLLTA